MCTSGKIIIGLTGPFGSGCSYIARNILEKMGYEYISLSDILRSLSDKQLKRTELQDFGNSIRRDKGNGFLAQEAIKKINTSGNVKFVIDSIRNTHEVEELKKTFPSFFLLATWANKEIRWERVKDIYSNNIALFEQDDKRDSDEKIENGQQITLCYQMSDVIILNETHNHSKEAESFENLKKIVNRYISIIETRELFVPNEKESLMTMAYANSMRSSCTQRKVGALIVDDHGNVFSSGYNEVPSFERSCNKVYGECYRKFLRKQMNKEINSVLTNDDLTSQISGIIKKNSKMLDYCRALHAEETAIVNMARMGVSANMNNATLYTTTYPCNLCANKIAQVGIKRVIYYEPYPQQEAKKILKDHKVEQIPFDGVTFNGYFRFMEVLR